MDLNELKKELKSFTFQEIRSDGDDYFEAVVTKAELTKLTPSLDSFFGPPVFPSSGGLSGEAKEAVKDFGGIMAGQTLYLAKRENATYFAMLWPWGGGTPITLKIGKK